MKLHLFFYAFIQFLKDFLHLPNIGATTTIEVTMCHGEDSGVRLA
jgi:hypothetical protein